MKNTSLLAILLVGVLFAGTLTIGDAYGAVFAKYDGIDGESTDSQHAKWIDVLSVDWGMHKQDAKKTRAAVNVIENMMITIEYEKAAPKILEAAFLGKVIPKLEIEQTATYGGSRATYLKYELTNVLVTSFQTNASGNDEAGPSTVVIGTNFEEIKVTYTEYDSEGNKGGNVETTWKVEKGEK